MLDKSKMNLKYLITYELAQNLLDYLGDKPAKEVFKFLTELQQMPTVEVANEEPKLVEAEVLPMTKEEV